MGAGRVIVIDDLDYRLENARAPRTPRPITSPSTTTSSCISTRSDTGKRCRHRRRRSRGRRQPDAAHQLGEAEWQGGSLIALNWAIDSVRKGGTVSATGAYGPMFSAAKFGDAMNKGLTLRMNQCPVKRQRRGCSTTFYGYLKPSEMITHRFRWTTSTRPTTPSAKLDNCIKPLILPNGY